MLVVSCVHHGSLDALARRGLLHVERFVDRCYRGRPWHRRAARLTKKGRAEVARLTLEEDALAEHLEADKW